MMPRPRPKRRSARLAWRHRRAAKRCPALLPWPRRRRTDADDHRRPPLHHLARDDAEPVRLALAIVRLDQDGSSLYVTEPFERNAKRAEPLGFYRRAAAHHHANARNPWQLLGGREAR